MIKLDRVHGDIGTTHDERRQHIRVDDRVYFNYKIIHSDELISESEIYQQLLGEDGSKHMEAARFFHDMDTELATALQLLSKTEEAICSVFRILHAKVDYLCREFLVKNKSELKEVNISLGGMSFATTEIAQKHDYVIIVLYAKPKFIPLFLEGRVIYSQYNGDDVYRTAIEFNQLSNEQEKILSRHIMHAQLNKH